VGRGLVGPPTNPKQYRKKIELRLKERRFMTKRGKGDIDTRGKRMDWGEEKKSGK